MFLTLFVIGVAGFAAMAILSFGHIGGAHHAFHAGHAGHTGHVGHVGARHSQASARQSGSKWTPWLLTLLSPIDIFSYALGFGATGLVLQNTFSGNLLIGLAIVVAIVFNLILIHPVMNLAMKFVSKESKGLEGAVSSEAEACGQFDAQGRGIIQLKLDGQIIQLLATLDPDELHRGVSVCRGDKVIILEVDGAKNQCRVSKDLAA